MKPPRPKTLPSKVIIQLNKDKRILPEDATALFKILSAVVANSYCSGKCYNCNYQGTTHINLCWLSKAKHLIGKINQK